MKTDTCRICNAPDSAFLFNSQLLDQEVDYFECSHCHYVQTEKPTWLDKAYASPINLTDTGILSRNTSNTYLVIATLNVLNNKSGVVLDFAGGYGFLVRMLRDAGIEAYWQDPYCDNLVARGFEYQGQSIDLLTAFEVLEHLEDPMETIQQIFRLAPNVLFSTVLIPDPAPAPKDWWYYGREHGQHIGFFRLKTLQYIAEVTQTYLITDGGHYHLFTRDQQSRRKWTLYRRMIQYFPKLLTRGLVSKTVSDHLQLARQARG